MSVTFYKIVPNCYQLYILFLTHFKAWIRSCDHIDRYTRDHRYLRRNSDIYARDNK